MKLPIENWGSKLKLSTNSKDLLDESVKCYKVGAYRASLLLSYLTLLTILKEKMLTASKPNFVPQGMWEDHVKNIQRENRWEETVFDSTQNTKVPVFQIDEHIRLQLKYWRDRRNDAAHDKENIINEHTIESFWSFIQSNTHKISVEGGMASLIVKFDVHFNPAKTPPGREFNEFVDEIPNAVRIYEFDSFMSQLCEVVEKHQWTNQTFLEICEYCLKTMADNYREKTIMFLKTHDDILVDLVLHIPSSIIYFDLKPEEVRELWKVKLKSHINVLPLLAVMLNNGLLSEDQYEEAFYRFYKLAYAPPELKQLDSILWSYGFYNLVYKIFFEDGYLKFWKITNDKHLLIMNIILQKGLDEVMVEKICIAFTSKLRSYALENKLNECFSKNNIIRSQFLDISKRLGLQIPILFTSLHSDEQ